MNNYGLKRVRKLIMISNLYICVCVTNYCAYGTQLRSVYFRVPVTCTTIHAKLIHHSFQFIRFVRHSLAGFEHLLVFTRAAAD